MKFTMTPVQVFVFVSIAVGLFVSYYPPTSNAAAIFELVGNFIGYVMRDLFPPTSAPIQVLPSSPTTQGD